MGFMNADGCISATGELATKPDGALGFGRRSGRISMVAYSQQVIVGMQTIVYNVLTGEGFTLAELPEQLMAPTKTEEADLWQGTINSCTFGGVLLSKQRALLEENRSEVGMHIPTFERKEVIMATMLGRSFIEPLATTQGFEQEEIALVDFGEELRAFAGRRGLLALKQGGRSYFMRAQVATLPGCAHPERWAEMVEADLMSKTTAQGVNAHRAMGKVSADTIRLANKTKVCHSRARLCRRLFIHANGALEC